MPLIRKLTYPELCLLHLAHSHQANISPALTHARAKYQAMTDHHYSPKPAGVIQTSQSWTVSSALPCLSHGSPSKDCGLDCPLTLVFCLPTTPRLSQVALHGMVYLLSPEPVSIINFCLPEPLLCLPLWPHRLTITQNCTKQFAFSPVVSTFEGDMLESFKNRPCFCFHIHFLWLMMDHWLLHISSHKGATKCPWFISVLMLSYCQEVLLNI